MEGKNCQNMKLSPLLPGFTFLTTTKLLERIRLHMDFTLFVNSLKKFFEPTKI